MDKAVIFTQAYNAESVLSVSIESVLNQTYRDFSYYICDNGSTDKTREIIMEYAKHDSRVKPILRDVNHRTQPLFDFVSSISEKDAEYFVNLDADDEYELDFLEKTIAFADENSLDITACSSTFIDVKTNVSIGARTLQLNLIIDDKSFSESFHICHQFMRTVWGKLFRISLIEKCDYKNQSIINEVVYGNDTLFCMRAFKLANRIGILADSLHNYHFSKETISYNFDIERIHSDQKLYDEAIMLLIAKVGFVSNLNSDFLLIVYLHSLIDTLRTLFRSDTDNQKRYEAISLIFMCSQTRELASTDFSFYIQENPVKSEMFKEVLDWIITHIEICSDEELEKFCEIIAIAETLPSRFSKWNITKIFKLIAIVHNKAKSENFIHHLNLRITEIASKRPLLAGFDAEFLVFFSEIVIEVLDNRLTNALEMLEIIFAEEREIPSGMSEMLTILGLNLAAKEEKTDYFLFFKKVQIHLLIISGEYVKAIEELADWDQLVPDDDFKELRRVLNK